MFCLYPFLTHLLFLMKRITNCAMIITQLLSPLGQTPSMENTSDTSVVILIQLDTQRNFKHILKNHMKILTFLWKTIWEYITFISVYLPAKINYSSTGGRKIMQERIKTLFWHEISV